MTPAPAPPLAVALAAGTACFWLWIAWNSLGARLKPPSLAGEGAGREPGRESGQEPGREPAGTPPGTAPDAPLPSLAIVSTARDEAEHIEAATRSLLAQDLPGTRVVVVDDRSTDATGEILKRLAASEPRLAVVRIDTLPEGWIGKCHALARGAALAGADWILFTDGDIVMAPDAARRALAVALRGGYVHVAVAPDITAETLGEKLFVGFFWALFGASQGIWRASDPRSQAFVGIGAFNLVLRDAYLRAGGHEAIRYELLDDMALGKILKRAGARQTLARHAGRVRTRWHSGVRGLIGGLEKNAFAAARYRTWYMSAAIAGLVAASILPYAGLLLPWPGVRALALLAWVGAAVAYGAGSGTAGIRPWHALLILAAGLLFAYTMARSMVMTLSRGGVLWRGTFYPLGELRRRQVF